MKFLQKKWKGTAYEKMITGVLMIALVLSGTPSVYTCAYDGGRVVSGGDVSGGDVSGGDVSGGNADVSDGNVMPPGNVSGGDIEPPTEEDGESSEDMMSPGDVSGGDAEPPTEEDVVPPIKEPNELEEETGAGTEAGQEQQDITRIQQIKVSYQGMYSVGMLQMGSQQAEIVISPVTMEEEEYDSPLTRLYYGYDGQEYSVECSEEGLLVTIPYEYFGTFFCYGTDEQGRVSNQISTQLVIDNTAPAITWEEVEVNDVRYLRITLSECGEYISGIDLTRCFIGGIIEGEIQIQEREVVETVYGQAVVGNVVLDVSLKDREETTVELSIRDAVGNLSIEIIEWSVGQMANSGSILSIQVPSSIPFTISTWMEDKQIHSEEFTIVNESACDIYLKFTNAHVTIDKSNVADRPELKDCEIYMGTEEGVRYLLPEGDSGILNIVRIPGTESGEDNIFSFFIEGYIPPDSDKYWRDDDISIALSMLFWEIREEEEEQIDSIG